jgi:hypothetical protein
MTAALLMSMATLLELFGETAALARLGHPNFLRDC